MSDAHREEIQKLEALYAEHPEGRIFTHLAEAYRKAGELESARAILDEGLQRHPDYSSAHVVRGRVLLDQQLPIEAEAAFNRVLELDAHNMVALRSLGDLARDDGRPDDALEYYQRLLEVEPADEDVRAVVEEIRFGGDAAAPEGREATGEEAQAGGPAAGGAGETAGEVASPAGSDLTWAPHGLVEGTEFEEAAWALSERADEDAGPDDGDLDDAGEAGMTADEGWLSSDEPTLPGEGNTDDWPSWTDEEDEGEAAPPESQDQGAEEPAGDGSPIDPFASSSFSDDLEEAPAGEPGEELEPAGERDPWESAEVTEPAPDEPETESAPEAPSSGPPGVMTETIAQVYARQGLYDQAAAVYRELVRERPNDAALRDRLTEMETLAEHAAETRRAGGAGERDALEDEAPWAAEPSEAEAPYGADADTLEGLESVEAEVQGADAVPLEGLETQDRDPETQLIHEPGPPGAEVESPGDMHVRDVPAPPEEERWESSVSEYDEAEPWADTPATPTAPAEPESAPPEPESAPPEPEDGSVWTGGDWAPPEAESPYAWAEPDADAEPDETGPIQQYFRGLLGWGGGERGAEAEPAGEWDAATPESRESESESREAEPQESESRPEGQGPEDPVSGEASEGGAPEPSQGQGPAGAGEGEGEGEDDDDDLEMFRSWLESLKK